MSARAIVVAAPASGAGKTTVVMGLLRALRKRGLRVSALKVGPDFIDPAFHAFASSRPCRNLDGWAMRPETLRRHVAAAAVDTDFVVIEGVMGLFDGAHAGGGATADIAALLNLPVLLVLDVHAQSSSAAAVALGFARYRDDVDVVGVILNRVASDRHREMIEQAFRGMALPVLGGLQRMNALQLTERHLGLVQAAEHPQLDAFLDNLATAIESSVDLDAILRLSRPLQAKLATEYGDATPSIGALGKHIAIASDEAFAFCYPHVVEAWQEQGATISRFSPLADEAPHAAADSVYLPGGYPEVFAQQLSTGRRWKDALRALAAQGRFIYGECGGFMALGTEIHDSKGVVHPMAGLLPHTSSLVTPRLSLSYSSVSFLRPVPCAPADIRFRAHEFHYAVSTTTATCEPLLETERGSVGLRRGSVCGSFVHLIDRET